MSQPHTFSAAPRWNTIQLTVAAVLAATILITAVIADLVITGWPLKSSPLWSIGIATSVLLAMAAVVSRAVDRVMTVHRRTERRIEEIAVGLQHYGVEIALLRENTGDIPRPIVVACPHGGTNGHGVDPEVVRAASRLQGRVIPLDR